MNFGAEDNNLTGTTSRNSSIYIYTELKSRISNYRSHHNKKNKSCGITEHFLEGDHIFEEHFQIQPIVRLLNPSRTVSKRRERLEEFELYWQMNLITYEPHGMNKVRLKRLELKFD